MQKYSLKSGYLQVYTGNSKGKTTAALGLAFRAAGHGLKTYIGQFMKGQVYGELKTAELLSRYITIEQFGRDSFVHVQNPADPLDVQMAQRGLQRCIKMMNCGEYDIVVLDEICVAHYYNLISVEQMLAVARNRPQHVEIIFTGRYCPSKVIEAADLVTEMTEIKHYYHNGIEARKGIER